MHNREKKEQIELDDKKTYDTSLADKEVETLEIDTNLQPMDYVLLLGEKEVQIGRIRKSMSQMQLKIQNMKIENSKLILQNGKLQEQYNKIKEEMDIFSKELDELREFKNSHKEE